MRDISTEYPLKENTTMDCATRAFKNLRYIQNSETLLPPAKEITKVIPLELLERTKQY